MGNLSKHLIAAILSIAFAAILYLDTFTLNFAGYLLPRILSATIVLLSLAMVAEAWRCRQQAAGAGGAGIDVKRVVVFIALIVTYIATINILGYFIVTPLYIVGTFIYLKAMSLRNSLLIAAGFTVFVYLLFVSFLQLPVPLGLME